MSCYRHSLDPYSLLMFGFFAPFLTNPPSNSDVASTSLVDHFHCSALEHPDIEPKLGELFLVACCTPDRLTVYWW